MVYEDLYIYNYIPIAGGLRGPIYIPIAGGLWGLKYLPIAGGLWGLIYKYRLQVV